MNVRGGLMERERLCIIGNAKSQSGNPITHQFSQFFITFIADAETGEILDLEASVVLRLTNNFIKEIFLGKSLAEVDSEVIEKIDHTYLGSSQKAIQVAYKDAAKKYGSWNKGIIITE